MTRSAKRIDRLELVTYDGHVWGRPVGLAVASDGSLQQKRSATAGRALLLLALAVTPHAARVAVRTRFLDHPLGYKQHGRSTPYLGGSAVKAALISADRVVGPGATDLVEARGRGEAVDAWPKFKENAAEDDDFAAIVAASATPHGFACLTITQAGSVNSAARSRAAERSLRLLYESSLPCSCSAAANPPPEVR